MKQSTLDKIRQEIERDTKAAQAEPERLARRIAEKLVGPLEYPKERAKEKEAEMDIDR